MSSSGAADAAPRHTVLVDRELAGEVAQPRPPSSDDAFAIARRRFGAGLRVEVSQIADELSVSRPTIYRWLGGREQILGEVLWFYAHLALRQGEREAEHRGASGADRVALILARLTKNSVAHPPLRELLRTETELALRLATSKQGPVQRRLIQYVSRLLAQETSAGRLSLPTGFDTDDLGYALIRIAETFVYADIIAGEEPNADRADRLIRLILRAPGAGND
jgi:AcrR family transcriptional regulator